MQVIKELLEVYNHFIKLPLIFVNTNKKIEHIEDYNYIFQKIEKQYSDFSDLDNFINYIKSPTVVAIKNEATKGEPHYIITPIFTLARNNFYIVAGPFSIYPVDQLQVPFQYLTEKEIEEAVIKMTKLFNFIRNKEKIAHSPSNAEQYIIILKELLSINMNGYERIEYLNLILLQILRIKSIDFVGIGYLKSNGLYEIITSKGDYSKELINKRFFLNEGILAKAIKEQRTLVWQQASGEDGADFFLRHNISPTQLLAIPYKTNDLKQSVLFVGNFSNEQFDRVLIEFLEIVISLFSNVCLLEQSLLNEQRLINTINLMNEVLNLTIHNESNSKLEPLIFRMLETITDGLNLCFTSINGNSLYSEYISSEIKEIHKTRLLTDDNVVISYNGKYIYYYLQDFGQFTIEMTSPNENKPFFALLNILNTIVRKDHYNVSLQNVFNSMYSNAKHLNEISYLISRKAISCIKKLKLYNSFNDDVVINLCKVMAFPVDHIEFKIGECYELTVLKDALRIINSPEKLPNYPLETQIFAFIYNKYVIKQSKRFSLTEEIEKIIEQEMPLEDVAVESNGQVDLLVVIDELPLTIREKQVLVLIINGMNNLEVAEKLSISIHTVKNHVTNIFKKLEVADRMQLMAKVIQIQTKSNK